MAMIRDYSYKMGFKINGTAIPDPSGFSGADSSLDASGERDATGELHRDMVATKRHLKLKFNSWDFEMITRLLTLTRGEEFQFTYPDPSSNCEPTTIRAYAGDRDWDVTQSTPFGGYIGNLAFSVIEF